MNDNQQPPELQTQPSISGVDNTASRGKRLAAAIIDIFLVMFCVQPFVQHFNLEQFAENPFNAPPEILFKILMYEVLVFFMLNIFILYRSGQTIGKRLCNIAIVDMTNQKPKLVALVFNRYLIQLVMMVLPFLNVVDILLIFFRKDKRCLHDLIANTKVIDLKIPATTLHNSIMA